MRPLIAISLPAILLLAGCAQRGPSVTPWEVFLTELRLGGSCGSGREPIVILQRLQRGVISYPHRGHGRFGRGRPCSSHQVGGTTPELPVLRGNWGWTPWQVWSVVEWAGAPDRGRAGAGCWRARGEGERDVKGVVSASDDELRRQIRARLFEGRLPPINGVSKSHRGTGRPCIVCRRAIEAAEVERELDGVGVVLIAHEACYVLWREESRARRDHFPSSRCRST